MDDAVLVAMQEGLEERECYSAGLRLGEAVAEGDGAEEGGGGAVVEDEVEVGGGVVGGVEAGDVGGERE